MTNVVGIQSNPIWEDKSSNFNQISSLLRKENISPNSLIVFPETFSTGFSLNTAITAENEPLKTLGFLSEIASTYGSWVMGGVVVKKNKTFRNRLLCINPAGKMDGYYDKIHLIPDAEEHLSHTAGNQCIIFTIGDLKVCPIICYDLRFPELFRTGIAKGANFFVVIACWPKVRSTHWEVLLQARAIENQSYLLGVNRTGNEPGREYQGQSMLVNPRGEIVRKLDDVPGILNEKVSLEEIIKWRNEFPVLNQRKAHLFSEFNRK